MMDTGFLKEASGTEMVFWAFALFGTVFFTLRVIAMAVGGLGSEDADDVDIDDIDADAVDGADGQAPGHSHHAEASNAAFKLLSIHSLTGFFMMFGWAGLAAYKQFGLPMFISFVVAGGVGLLTMYLTAYMFKMARQLTSRSAPFTAKDVVGRDATVYSRIEAGGRGKIQISFEGLTRFLEAVSDDGKEIDSFKVVHVARAMDSRTVAVRVKE